MVMVVLLLVLQQCRLAALCFRQLLPQPHYLLLLLHRLGCHLTQLQLERQQLLLLACSGLRCCCHACRCCCCLAACCPCPCQPPLQHCHLGAEGCIPRLRCLQLRMGSFQLSSCCLLGCLGGCTPLVQVLAVCSQAAAASCKPLIGFLQQLCGSRHSTTPSVA
jgi:hypothetical protein